MDSKVLNVIAVALFVLICGEILIWGFYAIQRRDKQIEEKVAEIKRKALVEIGQEGEDAQIAIVSAKFAPQGNEMHEVYILTVGGQKWRVWAKIQQDGAVELTAVEKESERKWKKNLSNCAL